MLLLLRHYVLRWLLEELLTRVLRCIRMGECLRARTHHWLHIVEHEHIQVFLKLLMSLRLRHQIGGRVCDRLTSVGYVIMVEDVLRLIE